jgi:hypothetical protein
MNDELLEYAATENARRYRLAAKGVKTPLTADQIELGDWILGEGRAVVSRSEGDQTLLKVAASMHHPIRTMLVPNDWAVEVYR